jgi:glycine/D-amino acid oxidase-like deaminating enzyme
VVSTAEPFQQLPSSQRVVIIGAGIVGNSLAYHVTRLGEAQVTLIDKGALPNPGGSTGHASNFIFPVDHSKEMTALTLESMRQYKELGVFTESGGIEIARTGERMQELARRMASAKSWGIEPVSLLTPREVKELVPFIEESLILGGFYNQGAGVVDSLQAGTIMRERAIEKGLTVSANTEVLGFDVSGGRVRTVHTTRGDIDVDRVVPRAGHGAPGWRVWPAPRSR